VSSRRSVLEEGWARWRADGPQRGRGAEPVRERPRRRWLRRLGLALLGIVVAGGVLLVLMASRGSEPSGLGGAATAVTLRPVHHPPHRSNYGIELAPAREQVRHGPKGAVRSGMLFDVRTGRVLWERDPTRVLPIASLTKMMTALVVVAHARPSARVLITREATRFTGSGVGLLPRGKRVPLRPLLYGLLLPSGNDAATALAQHVAGTQARFIAMMNSRAWQMGLGCTHYTTVSGVVDRGNHSCATDLAVLAHAMLENKLLAKIVSTRSAILPFPIKAHRLFLYNNNPLMVARYPGIDGVKTGFTTASGLCIVATARRGQSWLGVVLLHSVNWSDQAEQLLNTGFARLRRR
jgi:D-alanyl-D-alanine carboxypeptidase (penicillin-binding protein 5/6)